MTQILRSEDNPAGHKLEELLNWIHTDLETKNQRLSGGSTDWRQGVILTNNLQIQGLLVQAVALQLRTMMLLDEIEPDQRPQGEPHIKPDIGPFTLKPVTAPPGGMPRQPIGVQGERVPELKYMGVPFWWNHRTQAYTHFPELPEDLSVSAMDNGWTPL